MSRTYADLFGAGLSNEYVRQHVQYTRETDDQGLPIARSIETFGHPSWIGDDIEYDEAQEEAPQCDICSGAEYMDGNEQDFVYCSECASVLSRPLGSADQITVEINLPAAVVTIPSSPEVVDFSSSSQAVRSSLPPHIAIDSSEATARFYGTPSLNFDFECGWCGQSRTYCHCYLAPGSNQELAIRYRIARSEAADARVRADRVQLANGVLHPYRSGRGAPGHHLNLMFPRCRVSDLWEDELGFVECQRCDWIVGEPSAERLAEKQELLAHKPGTTFLATTPRSPDPSLGDEPSPGALAQRQEQIAKEWRINPLGVPAPTPWIPDLPLGYEAEEASAAEPQQDELHRSAQVEGDAGSRELNEEENGAQEIELNPLLDRGDGLLADELHQLLEDCCAEEEEDVRVEAEVENAFRHLEERHAPAVDHLDRSHSVGQAAVPSDMIVTRKRGPERSEGPEARRKRAKIHHDTVRAWWPTLETVTRGTRSGLRFRLNDPEFDQSIP